MRRILYLVGASYLAVSLFFLWNARPAPGSDLPTPPHSNPYGPQYNPDRKVALWWEAMKPSCNAVEVESRMRATPPPQRLAGFSYAAVCYTLAGRIDLARAVIQRLDGPLNQDRYRAASFVFEQTHAVADAGDDESASAIMELVLEFAPDILQARYHAGMAAYALDKSDEARAHLRRFVSEYREIDTWRSNALTVLRRLKD